jgi:hypothetical protein
LAAVFEAKGLAEIFVDVAEVDWVAALVIHYQSAYSVLVDGFGSESGGVGGFVVSLSGFFLASEFLVFEAQLDFLEVLGQGKVTSCS